MLATISAKDILERANHALSGRLKLLRHLVDQNSFTENIEGVNKLQSRLEDAFWELGLKTERHSIPNRGDILTATSAQASKSPILLVGHVDTVHAPDSSFKTFTEHGDLLRGPGVFDMKSGLIQIFIALDVLKSFQKLSQLPLKIIINSSEENSTKESVETICELSRGASAALVFELGRDNNGLVVERKGIIELWFNSTGLEAHSGNHFYDGRNAITPLIDIAQAAASLTNEEKDLTVNIARIDGGTQLCVVPGRALLGMEIRGGSVAVLDEALATIERLTKTFDGVTFKIDTKTAPLNKLPGTEALLNEFIDAGKFVGVEFSALPRVGGISDANHIGNLGIPTIDALGPTGGGAHTKEEFVRVSSIVPRAAATVSFLLNR